MRSFTFRSTPARYAGGLLLAYALVISLIAPFASRPVAASSAARDRAKQPATSSSAGLMAAQRSGRREGEVLLRFRAGASERDKDTIAISQGARRNKKLRGESEIEKLDISAGQEAETVSARSAEWGWRRN